MSVDDRPAPPDADLIRLAREGDDEAFRLLVSRRAPAMRARVRRKLPALLRRKVSESDVMQEALLVAHQKLAKFEDRGEGSFDRWLDQIIAFKLQDVLRHYRGTAKRGLDREMTQGRRPETRQFRAEIPSPSAAAVAGELREKVRKAKRELPDDYRRVIRLLQEQGHTLKEAGQLMDRSPAAVAKLYGRALCRLKGLVLGKDGQE